MKTPLSELIRQNDDTTLSSMTFVMVSVFLTFSLVCAALTLVFNGIIGPSALNLYESRTLGLMYWIDIVPHFGGGVSVGAFFLAVSLLVTKEDVDINFRLYFIAVLFTIFIGVGWEAWELADGSTQSEERLRHIKILGLDFLRFNQVKDVLVACIGSCLFIFAVGVWNDKFDPVS